MQLWFQVFQSNTNNFQNISIWPIHGTITISAIPTESGLESNGNEAVLPTPQSSEALSPDTV